jgi:hypothetical protein
MLLGTGVTFLLKGASNSAYFYSGVILNNEQMVDLILMMLGGEEVN